MTKTTINTMDILGAVPGVGAFNSATFASANRAHFQPFRVTVPCIIKQLFVANGATASGNIDLGVYAPDGTRLVSTGSTAQSGTNDLQVFDVTDTLIGRGYYYIAVAMDNTTGTLIRNNFSSQTARYQGFAKQDTAFPLPASATFASSAGQCYMMGVCVVPVL